MQKVLAVSLLSIVAFSTQALAATNFSGEWKLNVAKSEFGPAPAPELMERSIQQTATEIVTKTHSKGPQGESRTELKYTLDGKECTNMINGAQSKGNAKMAGDKLIIESTRDNQGMELKFKETVSLSDGGKVMTINNHVSVQGQEFDIVFVFDKQ
jgi:hypothetical protein